MQPYSATEERMLALLQGWKQAQDRRYLFLECYVMMTRNMLAALEKGEFHDPAWMARLLHRFAEYYFTALEYYEVDSPLTPPVWALAHRQAGLPETLVLQNLFLGINAHINYDLVLTTVELLTEEWAGLSEEQRRERHADFCQVNAIIAATMDAVQDEVVEKAEPVLAVVDVLMVRLDEWLANRLIERWRDGVWQAILEMLACSGELAREELRLELEQASLARAEAILLKDGPLSLFQAL